MAENYKYLYGQMKKLVEQYQDEIVPGMRKQIKELEQNRVEVRAGEWNFGKYNMGSETVFVECSECAAVFEVPTFIFGLNYNYCPNCGADMRGGAEDG